jgi:hypothetical protein
MNDNLDVLSNKWAGDRFSEPMMQEHVLDSKHKQVGVKTSAIVRIQEILGAKDHLRQKIHSKS